MKNVIGLGKPRGFVIAALRGGSGKTLVSVGLAAALKCQGYKVAPFKKGPDYIDAGWLAVAANASCYNLDPFLMSKEDIIDSFLGRSAKADIVLVEGNRGLFDGLDESGSCSTAELAKLLGLPIILIVDVTKMTRTTAALVYGCKNFDKDIDIAGVILNQVGTSRQEKLIRGVVEKSCGVPVVGAVPRLSENLFPERHLGLVPIYEHEKVIRAIDYTRKIIEETVDLERILSISKQVDIGLKGYFSNEISSFKISGVKCGNVVIGVIRDEAFQFYYPENLETLELLGAKLEFFSSIRDRHLPSTIDGLYIGGGFPEVYAEALAKNESLKSEIREAVEKGMPVYAECGGLMYLSEYIRTDSGIFPMVGVFPITVKMQRKPQGHGYVMGRVMKENPFFSVGTSLKAHEFHYSKAIINDKRVQFIVDLDKGYGIVEHFDGIMYKNCVALYAHIHVSACKEWAKNFIYAAHAYRVEKSIKLGGTKRFDLPAIDDRKCITFNSREVLSYGKHD